METKITRLRVLFSFALLTLWGFNCRAQETTLSSGETYSSGSGSLSFSAGQIAFNESSGSGGTASEGVQQAFEIFPLPEPETETLPKEVVPLVNKLDAVVYPNPTQTNLTLELRGVFGEQLNYALYDLQGRLIIHDSVTNTLTQIYTETLPSGTYLLRIQSENIPVRTFKIIRN